MGLQLTSADASGVSGQINASGVDFITISDVVFEGGGWNILMSDCDNVILRDCAFYNITASNAWCISLSSCTNVLMHGCRVPDGFYNQNWNAFVSGIFYLSACQYVDIISCEVNSVDNSYNSHGGSALGLSSCSYVNVVGGNYNNNANLDGITLEANSATEPCSYINIVGVTANGNGQNGRNGSSSTHANGSGLNVFGAIYVRVSNCHFEGNGYANTLSNVYLWSCFDAHMANCYIAQSGINGIEIVGAQNCTITDCTIDASKQEGIRVSFQGWPQNQSQNPNVYSSCTVSGTGVTNMTTYNYGNPIGTQDNAGYVNGTWIYINGVQYVIEGVVSSNSLVLQTSGGSQSAASWVVPSFVTITGGLITRSGTGLGGGSLQSGLHVQDLCYCQTTGTSFYDEASSQTQEYGIYIDSGATCNVYWPNFYPGGNQTQNISDNSGKNIFCVGVTSAPTTSSGSYPMTSGSVGFFVNQGATSKSTVLYVSQGNSISAITVP